MSVGMKFERFLERFIGGHISIGPITIYGMNAMHFATNVRTRWGCLCFRPTTYHFGRWWRWYAYLSPNGTPWAATWAIGPGLTKVDKVKARENHAKYGHGFDSRVLHPDIYPEVKQLYPQYFPEVAV